MYAALYHAHAPKLADLDIIEFDRDEEVLTPGYNAKQLLQVLERPGEATL